MQSLAESCSAQIIAEGIERETDCLTLRDMGIGLGQGYLIAVPSSEPRTRPSVKRSSLPSSSAASSSSLDAHATGKRDGAQSDPGRATGFAG